MDKLRHLLPGRACFLVAPFALALFIYSASLPKQFTNWDDPQYIVNNPLVQIFSFENLLKILGQPYFSNYAPVTLLSYTLDITLWGNNANAFHIHNVLLHLAAIAALYYLLGQLGVSNWGRELAVLIFAVHPINVESVSWASERKNLLSGLFFLLSFSQYVSYSCTRSRRPYLLSLLFFILSILAKAGTVVTPFLLLAFDYLWRNERPREIRWLEKLPFVLLTGAHVWLSVNAAGTGALHSYYPTNIWVSVLDTGRLIIGYLKILFWPVGLTPLITPTLIPSVWDFRVIVPFVSVLLTLVLWFLYARRSFFWVVFFLSLLAPVLNIVPLPVVMAYRYLHLPQIGVWVLLAGLLETAGKQNRWSRRVGFAVLTVWVSFLIFQAYAWAAEWRNSVALWHGAVKKNSVNLIARANLGQAYLNSGQYQLAADQFSTILIHQPDNVLGATGLAMCALVEGRAATARTYAEQATQLSPDYPLAWRVLGRARLLQRDIPGARDALLRAVELNPSDLSTLDDLITLYESSDRPLEGDSLAGLMIRNSPGTFHGYWARARLLIAARQFDRAIPSLEMALQLAGNSQPAVRARLSVALQNARIRTSQQAPH